DRRRLRRGELTCAREHIADDGRSAPEAEALYLVQELDRSRHSYGHVRAPDRIYRQLRVEVGRVQRSQELGERARQSVESVIVQSSLRELAAGKERRPVERPLEGRCGAAQERWARDGKRQEGRELREHHHLVLDAGHNHRPPRKAERPTLVDEPDGVVPALSEQTKGSDLPVELLPDQPSCELRVDGDLGAPLAHRTNLARPAPASDDGLVRWRRWFAAVGAVWAIFAAVGLAVFITYWRLPADQLYNVSNEGVRNGASRLLVFLNYPVSLAAIPIVWLAVDRLRARRAMWAAGTATVLCAVTAWPGVIDRNDLDAKPINVLPVFGLAIAFVLSALALWETIGARRLDPLRVGIGVVLCVAGPPWIFAPLGFNAPGDLFLGEELRRGGDGLMHPAVHLGEHEG